MNELVAMPQVTCAGTKSGGVSPGQFLPRRGPYRTAAHFTFERLLEEYFARDVAGGPLSAADDENDRCELRSDVCRVLVKRVRRSAFLARRSRMIDARRYKTVAIHRFKRAEAAKR